MNARVMKQLALVLVVTPLLVRASVPFSVMPGWDSDPMLTADAGAMGVLGPGGSALLDLCVLVGAMILSVRRRLEGVSDGARVWPALERVGLLGVWVLLVPFLLCLMLGWQVQDVRIAFAWWTAIVAVFVVSSESRDDPTVRGLVASVALGFMALLAVRAGIQFLVEHPATVAEFRENKDQFLLSRGWTADSTSARAYERRLVQPDASAWFALSNVLASFAAAGTVVCAGLLWASARWVGREAGGLRTRMVVGAGLGLGASVAALWFAHSKGGVIALGAGALALGVLLAVMSARLRGWRLPLVMAVGVGAVAGPIALVIGRGLVGERIGELSLLFRWFYMQGAAGVLAKYPLTGIGPDGFQQAFLLTKPALCPEDPTSAHSVLFDWAACLGVAGIALGLGLVVLSVLIAGSGLRAKNEPRSHGATKPRSEEGTEARTKEGTEARRDEGTKWGTEEGKKERKHGDTKREEWMSPRLVQLIPALATIVSAWIETPGMSPTSALARVGGLVGWCVIAGLMWRPLSAMLGSADGPTRGRAFAALAAGALTLIAHGQIEVTLTWAPSVGLAGMMLGVAWWRRRADGGIETERARSAVERGLSIMDRGFSLVLCLFVIWLISANVSRGMWGLGVYVRADLAARSASKTLAPLGEANARLADLQARAAGGLVSPTDLRAELDGVIADLRASYDAAGAPACGGIEDPLRRELCRATIVLGSKAAERLVGIGLAEKRDWRIDRALSEVHIRIATAAADAGEDALAEIHMDAAAESAFAHREDKRRLRFPGRWGDANWDRTGMNVPLLRSKALIVLTRAELRKRLGERSVDAVERQRGGWSSAADMLEALRCLERAHELDPTNPDHAARAAELAQEILKRVSPDGPNPRDPSLKLPDAGVPGEWARLALRLNEFTRLDPVGRSLSEERVRRLKALAGE